MLQIVGSHGAVCPIVPRQVRGFGSRARTGCRLAVGVAVAALVYFAVLFALTEGYSPGEPWGTAVFGAGFVVATLLAVVAGAAVSPKRLWRMIVSGSCALAVLFPFCLNVYFGVITGWRPIYLLYLLGSIWGGYAVAWLSASAGGVLGPRRL